MLTLNTNVMALNAQLALSRQTKKINQLDQIMTAANSNGPDEFSIAGPASSIIPTFLTSAIAGTAVAMTNRDKAESLCKVEQGSVNDMISAVNTMKAAAIQYNDPLSFPTYDNPSATFSSAQAQLSSIISSDVYNNKNLADGGNFQFQVGPNPNDKISLNIGRLDEQIGDLRIIEITGADGNRDYDLFIAALNHTKGSVDATISQLAFTKLRLESDYYNTTEDRKSLLSNAWAKASAEKTVQLMLQKASEAILAQANASSDGVIDLIKSARVSYA